MNFRKIVKKFIPSGLFQKIEPFGHMAEAILWNVLYGFPSRKFKVIGVTGTNGKTTTSYLIHRMLHESGYRVGLMSTVGYGVGANITPQMHHMTNVSVPEMMKRLRQMKREGAEWLVLETTSHALAQNRVWGVPYSVVVFTNITQEHLGYHKTFERYIAAKRKMFEMANRNKRGLRIGIVNAEDPQATAFTSAIENPLTYGVKAGDYRATDVELRADGVSYKTSLHGTEYKIRCRLPGSFNVYNSMAVVGVGDALGLTAEQIEKGIYALEGVEGRMTQIDEGQDFTVIVDYAHTPDSFEKLFRDLKPVVKGRLIVLFGSLGQGDIAKRAQQGRLAGQYADLVVLTEEDNRMEPLQDILDDIAEGVEAAGKTKDEDYFMVNRRPDGIKFAFEKAQSGDMVLLLGKGHEKTIEDAEGEHPWDEIGTAHEALKSLKN